MLFVEACWEEACPCVDAVDGVVGSFNASLLQIG